SWLIVCHADQVDLDQRVFDQQASRTDRRARWRDPEIFLPHLVKPVEVVEISEEDLRLDYLIERASCRLESLLKIFQDKASLQLDIRVVVGEIRRPPSFRRNAGFKIAGELARGEDETADLEGFCIVCKRLRCVRLDRLPADSFAGHAANKVDLDQRFFDQETSRTDRRARGRVVFGAGKIGMQTLRLPIASLVERGVDPNDIRSIAFLFDRRSSGTLYVGDVQVSN